MVGTQLLEQLYLKAVGVDHPKHIQVVTAARGDMVEQMGAQDRQVELSINSDGGLVAGKDAEEEQQQGKPEQGMGQVVREGGAKIKDIFRAGAAHPGIQL
jgi:hypothetical protein